MSLAQSKANLVQAYLEHAAGANKVSLAAMAFSKALAKATEAEAGEAVLNVGAEIAAAPEVVVAKKGKGKAKAAAAAAAAADEEDDEPAEPATKAKKEKKIKDPNAPKRPPSAYIEFQNNVRAKFREADPELSYAEVLRKIAAVWGTMSDDEKKPFQDTTKAKTTDFETAKAAYLLEYPDGWSPEGADAPAASADTPKKRGRKTAAEKAALAAKAAGDIVVDADELSPEEIKKAEKKAKKEAKPAAALLTPNVATPSAKAKKVAVPVKVATPEESEDTDSSAESSEESSEDELAAPVPSSSKAKRTTKEEKVAPKAKKTKTA